MLKPIPLHILLALAERDSHGYAVMQAIRERSDGQVPVQTASFYRHLAKLMDEGLVAEVGGPARERGSPARRLLPDHRRAAGRCSPRRSSGSPSWSHRSTKSG